jgi:histidyl-tRNA synthetase
LKLISHCGGGSFKNQFKRADRSGARLTLILGDEEAANKQVGVKTMSTGEQQTLTWDELVSLLNQ